MHINPIFSANVLVTLTESLMVGNHSVRFCSSGVTVLICSILRFFLFFFLQLRPDTLISLYLWPSLDIYISWGIDVGASLLFLQLHRVGADGSSPMEKGAHLTVFGCYSMVAIPMQILVSVSNLPVDRGVQPAFFIRCDEHIQKGYRPIFISFFTCEVDVVINRVKMLQEVVFLCPMDDDESIILNGITSAKTKL